MATLSAVISKLQMFRFSTPQFATANGAVIQLIGEGSETEEAQTLVKSINAQGLHIKIVQKANALIYVAISKSERAELLQKRIEFLHLQLVSITTCSILRRL